MGKCVDVAWSDMSREWGKGFCMTINKIKKRHRHRSIFFMKNTHTRSIGNKTQISFVNLIIPHTVTLSYDIGKNHRHKLIKTITQLHDLAKQNRNVCIDFSATNKIYVDGMILLYAEIRNFLNIYPFLKVTCKKSDKAKINHLLFRLGFFSLFKVRFNKTRTYDDVNSWLAFSGSGAMEEMYAKLSTQFQLSEDTHYKLYRGCIEATINSHHHAYIEDRELSKVNSGKEAWWLFAEKRNNNLCIAICDLGTGIASTIPLKYPVITRLANFLSKNSESALIKLAIETPNTKSRTGKKYRGNGLEHIANVAKNVYGSSILMYSHKACLHIENNITATKDTSDVVPGTIILWNIPIGVE